MSDLNEALSAAAVSPSEFQEALAAARGEARTTVSVGELIIGFDLAAKEERDPGRRDRLRAVVTALGSLSRDLAIDVAAQVIVRHTGI
jgi:hypothetical protein